MMKVRAVLLGLLTAVGGITAAQANVSNVRSVELQGGILPPGFHTSHVAVYSHAVPAMRVKIDVSGQRTVTSCAVPSGARRGWAQGLIQGFDRPSLGNALLLCAYSYHTAGQAHAAYVAIVRQQFDPRVKMNLAAHEGIAHLGSEATGLTTDPHKCPCGTVGFGSYELLFRHDNVVVDVGYEGPTQHYTMANFAAMARGTNAHLR